MSWGLGALIDLLVNALEIYKWIVIAAVLITWVNPDPYNPIVQFLRKITEPLFQFVRRGIPAVAQGGFDFSPIVILILVHLLQRVLMRLSFQMMLGY